MRPLQIAVVPWLFAAAPWALGAGAAPAANPAIDMGGYLRVANAAAAHRESHRLSEAKFIGMSKEPGTVILDARSRDKYDELHVKGAINLTFPDIAIESLERTLPDRNTRILTTATTISRTRQGRSRPSCRAHRSTSPPTSRCTTTATAMYTSSDR